MAYITKRVSDLSLTEVAEDQIIEVTIRSHPKLTEPKAFDALAEELASLKEAGDLVALEIKTPDGSVRDVTVKLTDFNKLAPNMDDVLAHRARNTKGRRPGYRPGANGS